MTAEGVWMAKTNFGDNFDAAAAPGGVGGVVCTWCFGWSDCMLAYLGCESLWAGFRHSRVCPPCSQLVEHMTTVRVWVCEKAIRLGPNNWTGPSEWNCHDLLHRSWLHGRLLPFYTFSVPQQSTSPRPHWGVCCFDCLCVHARVCAECNNLDWVVFSRYRLLSRVFHFYFLVSFNFALGVPQQGPEYYMSTCCVLAIFACPHLCGHVRACVYAFVWLWRLRENYAF